MLEDHPTFKPPEDENTKIWRYMDFTKCVSLLSTQSLFFARADLLGDPFEGSYPAVNVEARQQLLSVLGSNLPRALSRLCRVLPKTVAVNCWHMNETESAAMWKLYLKSEEGIAVRSTVGRPKQALDPQWPDALWIGKVTYVDYQNAFSPNWNNLLDPFVHKRSSFEHEHELRVVLQRLPKPTPGAQTDIKTFVKAIEAGPLICDGIKVPVNLDDLIERIVVAPTTPDWYLDLVRDVVARFNCPAEVTRSDLDGEPLY